MSEIQELDEILSEESQEQINNLENHPAIVAAFQKLVEKQLPELVAPVVKGIWESLLLKNLEPTMENLFCKFVKKQLEEKLNSGGVWISRDGASSSEPRKLVLEFLGKIGSKLCTGQSIKGEDGNDIRVALKDADGNVVRTGKEASSEVELMVLLEHSGTSGKELRLPLVSPNRLKLKEGIAVLEKLQLKRPVAQKTRRCSDWAQNCSIKLVARPVVDINGATVETAETGSFFFRDRRGLLYNKHFPPQLSDKVWRLIKIRRNYEMHKLLEKENINSVKQFLIAHTRDPLSLQKMLKISAKKLMNIVDHAKTCPDIPKSLHVYQSASWKNNDAVVFDVVGCARGLLCEGRRFVPADNLPEDLKADARKKIMSAFEHWEDVQLYNSEASTFHLPPLFIGDSTLDPSEAFGGLDNTSRSTGNSSGSTLEPNETFGGLNHASTSIGNSNGSTLEPNGAFGGLDLASTSIGNSNGSSLEPNEAFGGPDRASTSTGDSNGSTLEPNEAFGRLDCASRSTGHCNGSTLEPNEAFGGFDLASSSTGNSSGSAWEPYAMADAIISRGEIRSPFNSSSEWPGDVPMLERSDSDDLQHWIDSLCRSRGRLITCIVSVEKFISTWKCAMAQEVEARASKKPRYG